MDGYGNDGVTLNPTQVFSVHNWARKKNQAEGPSFTTHMLASCNADEHVAFKAFKTSSKTEKKDTKCTKPRAKSRRRKKQIPFSYNHPHEEIQSSSAMNSNPSQPQASTLVVAGMHKKVQQATSSPTSLGVTSEEAHPQLSSGNDEGPNKLSLDHISAGTNLYVLVEKPKSTSEWLETVLTQPTTGKEVNNIAK
ncbi:hypothetical protein Tco_1054140 [Tanacetum coccineum]|uniref:Uncharacterized protein n=1 Tax=Tanacetum coccineum TaxID=301880 RepID=A0ABQ5GVW8_9ASTR